MHVFELAPGVNILVASNAQGKSSVIKALKSLLVQHYDDSLINQYEQLCKIRLITDDGRTFEKMLERENGKAVVKASNMFPDGDIIELTAFIDLDSSCKRDILLDLKGEALISLIQKVTRLEHYEREIRELRFKLEEAERRLKDISYELAGLEYALYELKRCEKELKDTEDRLSKVNSELEEIRKAMPLEAYQEVAQLDQALEKALTTLREKEARIERLRSRFNQLESEIKRVSKRMADIKSELEKTPLEILKNELAEKETSYEKIKRKLEAVNLHIQLLEIALRMLPMDKCPLCEREINSQLLETIVSDTIKKLHTERDIALSQRRECEHAIREIKERIALIDRLSKEHEEREIELSKLREEYARIKKELQKAAEDFDKAREAYMRLKDKLPKVRSLLVDKTLYERKIEELREKISRLAPEAHRYKKLTKEQEELEHEIALMKREIQLKEDALKNRQRKFLSMFNSEVNAILRRMRLSNIEKVSLNADGTLVILRPGNKEAVPAQLSRSEKVTIGIVLLLSLYLTFVKEKFPLFVLDEIDQFYDAERLRVLTTYLSSYVPYLLITVLSKSMEEPLKLVHSFDSLTHRE